MHTGYRVSLIVIHILDAFARFSRIARIVVEFDGVRIAGRERQPVVAD